MDTGSIQLDYRTHRIPFDRVDQQDYSHLMGIDTLIDYPEVILAVRFRFRQGIGFEVITSAIADAEDWDTVLTAMGGATLLRVEPLGFNASGYAQWRSQYWAG